MNYDYKGEYWTRYPFPELWDEVYDTIIKDPKVFFNLRYAIETGFDETTVKDIEAYRKAEKTIFGNAWSGYHYNDPKYISSHGGHSIYQTIHYFEQEASGSSFRGCAGSCPCSHPSAGRNPLDGEGAVPL